MTERPPRVLLASHYYPPHVGGIETVVRQQAIHLSRLGADVTVLTTGPRAGCAWEDGVRVARVAAWNALERRTGVPFPMTGPALLPAARHWVGWADAVHLHDSLYPPSWAVAAAARRLGRRYVMTQHVAVVDHPAPIVRAAQHAVYRSVGRRILRGAHRVLVVNETVGAFVRAHRGTTSGVRHFPNGVDADLFRPADPAERLAIRRRLGLPADRVLVLFVGRLVAKKGYDLLLAAADPAYDLVFAGGGPGARELAGRRGVHDLGALAPDRLANAYRACDVFALPSVSEGFPLTVQEAMASGLPVVTTDDPGYSPYALDPEHVTLLPREPGRWRAALAGLAADRDRRLLAGRWSRSFAVAEFAWDRHAEALLTLYAGDRTEVAA